MTTRYIMMNKYDISMHDVVTINKVSKTMIRLQLHMILRAVASCHFKNIVHRDIKLGNILVGKDYIPKLIDFGMSWIVG